MTNEPVHFYGRNKPFSEFSNFHEAPIELDGYTWPTTEHYFQAQKFVDDQEHYLHVLNLPAPRAAFNYVRTYKSFVRPDWTDVKDEVMLKACMAKFEQHKDLKDLLLSTGDRLLVEHTENDSYWGDGGDGSGRNQLGITLMKIVILDGKVIAVGRSVAGALTALFLKQNGFSTEIYERVAAFGDAGVRFIRIITSNGIKVSMQIPGLTGKFVENGCALNYLSHRTSDGAIINEYSIEDILLHFGHPFARYETYGYVTFVTGELNCQRIPVHFNKPLCGITHLDDHVVAQFKDGSEITGDFLIGADGLCSSVRQILFGVDQSTYTGLTQNQ
ncbi:unnamed protein product [Adineta ricciae]|uniref:NADAR domain-containing protein n=1 Tax=Adineta ricciae TaxID=249248 RepID=A0A813S855_ADIRI|nr:unnamed protein product [Adineta ricciae]CAF1349788.1 unnamed protein product [Adineta ricciae]